MILIYQGDSGGPLICSKLQVGVHSKSSNCRTLHVPIVMASVPHLHNWISSTLDNATADMKSRNGSASKSGFSLILYFSLLEIALERLKY